MKFKQGKKYNVIAKEWYDRPNGNTYVSVRIYDNDVLIGTLPMEYGYGEHYLQIAKDFIVSRYENKDSIKSLFYRELFGIKELLENCLKRDVVAWGE